MIRFIHSADWQLGARFSQFGVKGPILRQARLESLKRALDIAQHRQVDAFIVAGDLFEDSQVDESLVAAVVDLFDQYSSLLIFLLPGNHDPFSGPDSVWVRRPFLKAGNHIRILGEATAIELGDLYLLASPLMQKMSTLDPSLKLRELAAEVPSGKVKIGITHGALAIAGKHQTNDFPIALDAASRAGLDYLAIGHWHNWLADIDGGRIIMPGTPEPDSFDHKNCGYIAYVEIDGPGMAPRVEPVSVASLSWHEFEFDLLSADSSRATLSQKLSDIASNATKAVIRVTLLGASSPRLIVDAREWLDKALKPFFIGQISDKSAIALSSIELHDMETRHPILAQVLADIDQLETFATGRPVALPVANASPLSLSDAQAILSTSKINLSDLTSEQLTHTRQLLLQLALEEAT